MKTAILLSFDCLPARLLGCYGNDSVVTPNFDRLAAESVVFDHHQSSLAKNVPLPPLDLGLETLSTGTNVESFSLRDNPDAPFTFQQSPLVRMIHQWKEVVTCGAPSGSVLFQLETTGLSNPWFPCEELPFEPDEDDAEPNRADDDRWFGGWSVPPDDFDSSDVARSRERAECFLEMLDAGLGMLLDFLDDTPTFSETLLIVTARHGFDFGESKAREVECCFGVEWTHIPLIVRGPQTRPARRSVLSTDADLGPALRQWFCPDDNDSNDPTLLHALECSEPLRNAMHMQHGDTLLVRNADFVAFRHDAVSSPRLYLLPDDPWFVHDAAAEYPSVIEELLKI